MPRMVLAMINLAAGFKRHSGAAVAPLFALTLVPILVMVGMGIDYTFVTSIRTSMQGALDAAVIAGAKDGSSTWSSTALATFNGNFNAKGSTVGAPSFTSVNNSYSGSASGVVATNFVRVLGISTMNFSAQSTAATVTSSPNQYCIMALNKNALGALALTGNASIDIMAPKCVLQVNSSAFGAVNLTGNATIHTTDNCFVGTVTTTGNTTVSPAPDPACQAVNDPLANYPRPAVGSCSYTNYSLSGNSSATLNPGVYCGGMSFSGKVNVTFNPGLYIVKDGVISESGGTFGGGSGVSFFLTGQGAAVQMSGNADWHLSAMTSGPLAGFVMFVDPNGPSGLAGASSTLSGNSELFLEGVVYMPSQQVTVTGNGQVNSPSPYTSFIADTVSISGNGQFIINNDTSQTSVPIPPQLQLKKVTQVRLTQ